MIRGIAMTGLAGAGKNAVGDVLVQCFGFQQMALADPIKDLALREFGWDGQKDVRGRRLLQVLGTEAGREYRESIWLEKLVVRIATCPAPVVVTDVRFANELTVLRGLGFVGVHIDRPGLTPMGHESEAFGATRQEGCIGLMNHGTETELCHVVYDMALDLGLAGSPRPYHWGPLPVGAKAHLQYALGAATVE